MIAFVAKLRGVWITKEMEVVVWLLNVYNLAFVGYVCSSQRSRCKMPADWKGHYYQSGLGSVVIREHHVTTKGDCVEQNRDYYIFENKSNHCQQCLLMIRRHPNIIQYKESYCLLPERLSKICAQIHVESPLYTLVRDPALSIPCPFEDAYYFDYSDHQNGFCTPPISYAKPCVGHSKYLFHFKHCINSAAWNGKDVDFECLATWKDGSESYLYSRITTATSVSVKDDHFRCLKYQYFGNTEMFLAMSVDATCRGLRSSIDGPFVMTLKRDEFGWPSPTCTYPDWLAIGRTWRDLDDDRRLYSLDDERGMVFTEYYLGVRKPGRGTSSLSTSSSKPSSSASRIRQLVREDRCLEVLNVTNTGGKADEKTEIEGTFRSFSTQGCVSQQQCLKFVHRAPSVIELFYATPSLHSPDVNCLFTNERKTSHFFIPADVQTASCPLSSFLYGLWTGSQCLYIFLSDACLNDSFINNRCNNGLLPMTCLYTWVDDNGTYVVVNETTHLRQNVFCPDRNVSLPTKNNRKNSTVGNGSGKNSTSVKDSELAMLISLTFIRLGNSNIYYNHSKTSSSLTSGSHLLSMTPNRQLPTALRRSTPTAAIPQWSAYDKNIIVSTRSASPTVRTGDRLRVLEEDEDTREGEEEEVDDEGEEGDLNSGDDSDNLHSSEIMNISKSWSSDSDDKIHDGRPPSSARWSAVVVRHRGRITNIYDRNTAEEEEIRMMTQSATPRRGRIDSSAEGRMNHDNDLRLMVKHTDRRLGREEGEWEEQDTHLPLPGRATAATVTRQDAGGTLLVAVTPRPAQHGARDSVPQRFDRTSVTRDRIPVNGRTSRNSALRSFRTQEHHCLSLPLQTCLVLLFGILKFVSVPQLFVG